jgi:hypothetical protein
MILGFNTMYLPLSNKLSSVSIVFLLLLKWTNCDCGRPGIPLDGYIDDKSNQLNFSEDFKIAYNCHKEKTIIYNPSRTCREGKWTGRVPKCGNYSILETFK